MLEKNMEHVDNLTVYSCNSNIYTKKKQKNTIILVSTENGTFHWETETFKLETNPIVESVIRDWCGF